MPVPKGSRLPEGQRVPYTHSLAWPGITEGHDARCMCTWAMKDGVYQVKFASSGCPVRGHARPAVTRG